MGCKTQAHCLPDYVAHGTCWSVLQLPSDLQHLVFLPVETGDFLWSPRVSSEQAVEMQEEHSSTV